MRFPPMEGSPPDMMLHEWEARGFGEGQIMALLCTMLWIAFKEYHGRDDLCPLCGGPPPRGPVMQ